jgi:predicted ArsR family transcriptional regulator
MFDRSYVVDLRAAASFSKPRQRRLVLEMAGRERSLKQLAEATGMPLNLLHSHIGRLLDLGLVRVVRRERRHGRPVKIYRAVAEAFFVPAHVARPSVQLASELRRLLDREEGRGVYYYYDERRGPTMERGPAAGGRSAELWRVLKLTEVQARELGRDLAALFARYERAAGRRGRQYLCYAALARR